jgi:hypothetical protein
MHTRGQPKRANSNRIIALYRDDPKSRFLKDRTDRPNSNRLPVRHISWEF